MPRMSPVSGRRGFRGTGCRSVDLSQASNESDPPAGSRRVLRRGESGDRPCPQEEATTPSWLFCRSGTSEAHRFFATDTGSSSRSASDARRGSGHLLMARATTPTWLSLDRFFQILGVNPLHANQLFSSVVPASNCNDAWTQFAYQNPNYTSREDLAQAIRDAEMKIASELGYFLLPDWVADERRETVRPARPELFSRASVNVRGLAKSVERDWGYVISGGQRAETLIDDAVAVTVSDVDGDGYDERAVATVATAVTSPCEIRAFLPGQAGSFAYEIRPITLPIAGGGAVGSHETPIVVARFWKDPQSQANLLWEHEPSGCSNCNGSGCVECSFSTQTGCLAVRNERLGEVTYRPATWDSVDEQFDTAEFAERT